MNTITINDGISEWSVEGNDNIQENLKALLGGKFFNVEFIKANGDARELAGRLGVHKHTNGNGKHLYNTNVITVYVPAIAQYRKFDLKRLKKLTCGDISVVGEAA